MGNDALDTSNDIVQSGWLAAANIYIINNTKVMLQQNHVHEGNAATAFGETLACLAGLYSNTSDAVFIENENRHILFANEAFCALFGITEVPHTIIGTDSVELFRKNIAVLKDPPGYISETKKILKDRVSASGIILELVDGRVFSLDYAPIIYDNVFCGNFWKYTDVTARYTKDKELAKQKHFYEQILFNIPGDIAVFDTQHKYLFINPAAVKNPEMRAWLIGKDDEEYCRHTNKPYNIATTRNRLFEQALTKKKVAELEEELIGKDGKTEHHLRKFYPVLDENGNMEMVVGYGLNITENKEMEDAAQTSQKKYKEIFNYSQAWICTHTLTGEILTINPAACNILGMDEQDLIGENISNLLYEKNGEGKRSKYLQKIIDDGISEDIITINNKYGHAVHLLYQNYLLSEGEGEPYVIGFAQNITDRLNAEEALRRSEDKYKKIIENMNLGMLEIDADERIIFANQQFCIMSGYSPDELYMKKATELLLENPHSRAISEQTLKRQYSISNKYEFKVKTKAGEMKWWLVSTAPLYNSDGTMRGSVSIHLDITRQKKLENDLREAMNAAEHSSQAKEAFLANMSHEIRTPINAIMGMGKLLSKSQLNEQQHFYLSSIRTASENLLVVINDILDISKIESGQISLEHIPFDMDVISKHAIAILNLRAEEKGLEVTSFVEPTISQSLLGDPYRINQIFINMISNAIKFTESGHVHFNASLIEQVEDTQKILITIEDTGVGIHEDFLNVIFNKFTQEDETIVRNYGGTGLGMSITKQLVELMGGAIDIRSKKNVGTTITITLTFKIGSQKIFEKKRAVRSDVTNISNKKVLLVEDNELNKLLAYTILTQYGAIVTSAENGIVALECIKKENFDIILMDVQMPKMDGVQATQLIRNLHGDDIPIIALTANAIKGKKEEYIAAGMNDYVTKPYNEEKMINVVSNWLHKTQKNIPVTDAFAEETEELIINTDGPLFDTKNLIIDNYVNNDFIVQMLSIFINEAPQTMLKIKDLYHLGDFVTLKHLAHRLRPSISNLCINSIKNEAMEIERLAEKGQKSPQFEKMIDKMIMVVNIVSAKMKADYNI